MTEQDEYEAFLYEQIRKLQNEYQKAAQPFVNELVRLRKMDIRPQVFILSGDIIAVERADNLKGEA